MKDIHHSSLASQPWIRFDCNSTYTEPSWGPPTPNLPDKVYDADSGELYTFEATKVTCPQCLLKLGK